MLDDIILLMLYLGVLAAALLVGGVLANIIERIRRDDP